MIDKSTKSTVEKIPLLKTNAGPKYFYFFFPHKKQKKRDPKWLDRLTEEYLALIKYVEINK